MLIVANWKAYVEELSKARVLLTVSKRLARSGTHQIVLAPPSPLLGALAVKNTSPVMFAAQDISLATAGADTGEATAAAFTAAGATYTIVGHSERRSNGETDVTVSQKIVRALAQGLTPILCVGERERDGEGRYLSTIREQITTALSPLLPKERGDIVVAYEPLWAIGKTAEAAISAPDLAEMALYIRKVLSELLPGKTATRSVVLYGGSVEPENIRALAGGSGIDGFLIGHASTDPRVFAVLVKNIS